MNTNVTYISRVQSFLGKHFISSQPFESIAHSDNVEQMLSKNWPIWRDLLRILLTVYEVEKILGFKMPIPVEEEDILNDGTDGSMVAERVCSMFVVKMIVEYLEHYDEIALTDQASGYDFMKKVFACLQTIHGRQAVEILNKVQSSMGSFPMTTFNQKNPLDQQVLYRGDLKQMIPLPELFHADCT